MGTLIHFSSEDWSPCELQQVKLCSCNDLKTQRAALASCFAAARLWFDFDFDGSSYTRRLGSLDPQGFGLMHGGAKTESP